MATETTEAVRLPPGPRIPKTVQGIAFLSVTHGLFAALARRYGREFTVNFPRFGQEVVISGEELRRPGCGLAALPVPVSTPGFDSAPYLTATLCITRDPDSGVQNMGMYRAALKATDRLAVRMVARPSGGAGLWRVAPAVRRRSLAWRAPRARRTA